MQLIRNNEKTKEKYDGKNEQLIDIPKEYKKKIKGNK